MSPTFRAAAPHWISGLALAVAGVALARLVAPACTTTEARALVAVAGEVIALGGLAVILCGIRRRLHSTKDDSASSGQPLV